MGWTVAIFMSSPTGLILSDLDELSCSINMRKLIKCTKIFLDIVEGNVVTLCRPPKLLSVLYNFISGTVGPLFESKFSSGTVYTRGYPD